MVINKMHITTLKQKNIYFKTSVILFLDGFSNTVHQNSYSFAG